ncbi:MAG: LacI family DNA-binding transcriptional regulator, partial [Lachnospiraceae bacterium]|nr:LacI family DNA-binding transcriptional regulator [Lachnospiraceae bacterium]
MVTITDISRKCGVSRATVSKALNGHSDVNEQTAARVRQAAKELGYTANTAARALKTNRTYSIGILFSDLSHRG